jgi:hypothetical protein
VIRWLAAPELQGRYAGSGPNDSAVAFVERELRLAGFSDPRRVPDGKLALQGWAADSLEVRVGECERPGAVPLELVSAHLDGVGRTSKLNKAGVRTGFCPAADDNASGVALLLETARRLGTSPPTDLCAVLVFSNGEELGVFGVLDVLQELVAQGWPKERTTGIAVDSVGHAPARGLQVFTGGDRPGMRKAAFAACDASLGCVLEDALAPRPFTSEDQAYEEASLGWGLLTTGRDPTHHGPDDLAEGLDLPGILRGSEILERWIRSAGLAVPASSAKIK